MISLPICTRTPIFGKRLGDHQGVGFMLADNEMDILTTRLAVHYCAQVLDLGEKGNYESSLVKVISSEGIWRVVDRSVQILGGQAMTDESVVCKILKMREVLEFMMAQMKFTA